MAFILQKGDVVFYQEPPFYRNKKPEAFGIVTEDLGSDGVRVYWFQDETCTVEKKVQQTHDRVKKIITNDEEVVP